MAGSVKIDPENPDPAAIRAAARLILAGKVVVFPTRGLYGLAADAFNLGAVERVFAIKHRPADKPLSILIPDRAALERVALNVPLSARGLMARFWPGGVTFVFAAAAGLPERLTAGTGKIGVRLPGHAVAAALVRGVNGPITATSANRSGQPGCWDPRDLDPEVAVSSDLVLDAGPLAGGPGSTIVDVTTDPPTVLREGSVPAGDILAAMGW